MQDNIQRRGRPHKPAMERAMNYSIRLYMRHILFLQEQENASAFIRKLIDKAQARALEKNAREA